jgi:hypothetical protein
MSFYDTVNTSKHPKSYYVIRDFVRVAFWGTLIIAPLYVLFVLVA